MCSLGSFKAQAGMSDGPNGFLTFKLLSISNISLVVVYLNLNLLLLIWNFCLCFFTVSDFVDKIPPFSFFLSFETHLAYVFQFPASKHFCCYYLMSLQTVLLYFLIRLLDVALV